MPGSVAAALLEQLGQRVRHPIDTPLLVVVAHPDDEVIGLGTRLPHLRRAHIVYVTDGAPRDDRDQKRLGFATREAYAEARALEADAGLALVGIGPDHVYRLNLIDQEAVHHVSELTHAVAGLIRDLRPAVVVTHAYEGGHPDHDATALAVHLSCRLLRDASLPAPSLLEFAGYHDPDGSGRLEVLEFLPGSRARVVTAELDAAEQEFKRRLVACHATQAELLRQFPLDRERFRAAPSYDFLAPPHPWRPFYERFVTGLDGASWRAIAAEALARFGMEGRL
ncbi:PIG-L deacetylase family protein [Benzoatithermus flavus]|uniref:PIG-L family deacetylase n=1 Tax=Benzoatithermus flavus TaxID=3108223 RepID=A0ABU8XS84_9PROT